MSDDPRFGVLRKVSATVDGGWRHEAHDFTPWLADNLDLLGRELGLALELREREHPVGRYSLDLLLVDAAERVVIVENQFGQTDHDHLGKLLTYCAGTNADVVVWIAETLTPEHVAALEWLNDATIEGVGFFGVELELLRIDGSLPAPHFRVVVQPNDWAKRAKRATTASVEWDWRSYAEQLGVPDERLHVGRALVDAVAEQVERRGLNLQQRFRQGYVAFQRPGGYNVVLIDVYTASTTRFSVKLPAHPERLGLTTPYPQLSQYWVEAEREWGWLVPAGDAVLDVGPALDATIAFQPSSGPMAAPTA